MKSLIRILAAGVFLLCCSLPAFPQAQATSADLRGTVTDQNGAVVAGANVTLSSKQRNITRTAKTDERGQYQLLAIPPGAYDMTVEATGFATQVNQGLVLTVGQSQVLDVQMSVKGATEQVVVTTQPPLVEIERTQQSNTIDERRIEDLPINRRNFLDFTLLVPGVTDSNAIADNSDFRVVQTPQSGLSFYGSNGRGNSITIDGAEDNSGSGGVRSTVSQDAVQEFQVNRSNYSAEFGGASGGIVNIVTKTGTNEWHGDLFFYGRNEGLDARNAFDFDPTTGQGIKPDFRRYQLGGTIGGPIQKDKTFFFLAYEHLRRDENGIVPIVFDKSIFQPTTQQQQLIGLLSATPFAPVSAGLQAALTASPATVGVFNQNSGIFPFIERDHTPSIRIDHTFSQQDTAFFRANYTNSEVQNTDTHALVGITRASNTSDKDGTVLASWSHVFGGSAVNEFRAQYGYTNILFDSRDPNGPTINVNGFGFFGRNIFLPDYTREQRWDLVDNFTKTIGNHTIKFGGDFNPDSYFTDSRTFFAGRFEFGAAVPLFELLPGGPTGTIFQQLNSFLLSQGAANVAGSTVLVNGHLTPLSGAGGRLTVLAPGVEIPIADVLETPITALQAYNLGLPLFYQQGFGDPIFIKTVWNFSTYVQDSWKIRPNLTLNYGVRYELNPWTKIMNVDKNNFAPRVGFSWDPWSDHKMVVRGGFGIYYSPIYAQIPDVIQTLNDVQIRQTFITLLDQPVSSAAIYQTLLGEGVIGHRQIQESDLAQFGIVPGPNSFNSVKFVGAPNYVNPYTEQASFGIERQLGKSMALSLDYIFVRGAKIPRAREINYVPNSNTELLNIGAPAGIIGFNEINGAPIGTGARIDPRFLQLNQYESSANSFYHGLTVTFTKRYSSHFSINANYTFSKSIDEVVDFNSDFSSASAFCQRCERALSAFDQRHRFVFTAVFDSPMTTKADAGFVNNLLADWGVAPIFTAGSARPFNLLAGVDLNGDNQTNSDRPIIGGVPIGRNTGIGPNFFEVDLRIARKIKIRENTRLELLMEGFNIFNRTNFSSVNNFVGPNYQGPINPNGIQGPPVTVPLAFTSAYAPRQIQFGAKLTF